MKEKKSKNTYYLSKNQVMSILELRLQKLTALGINEIELEINKLLVNEAKKNKRVLRLKGGDPFIFGRGGEEALTLKLNNIPYKIVPGTTAGIAGLAYAGIPATHRDFNTSVTFSFSVIAFKLSLKTL